MHLRRVVSFTCIVILVWIDYVTSIEYDFSVVEPKFEPRAKRYHKADTKTREDCMYDSSNNIWKYKAQFKKDKKSLHLPIYIESSGAPYIVLLKGKSKVRQLQMLLDTVEPYTMVRSKEFIRVDPKSSLTRLDCSSSINCSSIAADENINEDFNDIDRNKNMVGNKKKKKPMNLEKEYVFHGRYKRGYVTLGIYPFRKFDQTYFEASNMSRSDRTKNLDIKYNLRRRWPRYSGADGVLGLGLDMLPEPGDCNEIYLAYNRIFLHNMLANSFFKKTKIAFYFDQPKDQYNHITFGGWDPRLVNKTTLTHSRMITDQQWAIRIRSVSLKGVEDSKSTMDGDGRAAIIDTISPYIYGPKRQIRKLLKSIIKAKSKLERQSKYKGKEDICDFIEDLPPIRFVLSSNESPVLVPASRYIQKVETNKGSVCYTLIKRHPRRRLDGVEKPWILGRPFIQGRYTILDFQKKRISFTNLKFSS